MCFITLQMVITFLYFHFHLYTWNFFSLNKKKKIWNRQKNGIHLFDGIIFIDWKTLFQTIA